MISASKMELARHCTWWARADSPRNDTTSPEAQAGRDAHAAIERVIKGGQSAHPAAIAVQGLDLTSWAIATHDTEVALEYDPQTRSGSVVNARDRAYKRRPDRLYGTADFIAVTKSATLIICDWKTGRYAPPATDNAQLLTLAVMASAAYNLPVTGLVIAHVRDDAVKVDLWSPDDLDLAAHAAWLASLTDAAIEASEPQRGDHCRKLFCASYGLCPATSGGVDRLVTIKPKYSLARSASAIKSADHAAWQYEALRQAKAELATLWGALAEYVGRHGAIEIGDGVTWGPKTSTRREVDADADGIYGVLRDVVGQDADTAFVPHVTVASLKRAARAAAQRTGESIASVEKRLFSALEEKKIVEVKVTQKMEES